MRERFETFTALIARISRSIRKIKNQEMAEYGLKSPHVCCLYYIYLSDGLTATELCERCEEDKATISRSLDYLERQGYLLGEPQQTKRYKSPRHLTERGREVGAKIAEKIARVLSEVGINEAETERVTFYRELSDICERLEETVRRLEK